MHISEPPTPDAAAGAPRPDYRAALHAFAARHVMAPGWNGAVEAYHAVRDMPYFSGPDRTPLAALRTGRGACTAKHLILRDLLHALGFEAEVELVEGDFAAAVPEVASMPASLRETVRRGGIRDIHCWVRAWNGGRSHLLDATWPDELATYGFDVNTDWSGAGDTRQAVLHGIVRDAAVDVLARKAELLADLSEEETRARRMFLQRLSAWLSELPDEKGRSRK